MKTTHDGVTFSVVGDPEVDSACSRRSSFVSRQRRTRRNSDIRSFLASGIGFLADAYDFFIIDSVFEIIKNTSATPDSDQYHSIVATATLVGAVIGQLGFGLGADFIGRRLMFLSTSILVIFGSLASAVVGIGYQDVDHRFPIFYQLAICRFLLGVGIGGEYPLSATVSVEALDHDESDLGDEKQLLLGSTERDCCWFLRQKPNSLAAVFSLQGAGLLLSSAVMMFSLVIGTPLEMTWRICLAVGAIPSAIAFYLRWRMHETKAFKKATEHFYSDTDSSTCTSITMPQLDAGAAETPRLAEGTRQDMTPSAICNAAYFHCEKLDDITLNSSCPATTLTPATPDAKSSSSGDSTLSSVATVNPTDATSDVAGLQYSSVPVITKVRKRMSIASRFAKHCKKCAKILYTFRYALLGSSLSWFLIDVTLYGVANFKTNLSTTLLGTEEPHVPATRRLLIAEDIVTAPVGVRPFDTDVLGWHPIAADVVTVGYPDFQRPRRLLDSQPRKITESQIRASVLKATAVGSLFPLVGIPGYILSIFFIHKTGTRQLQLYGFYLVAAVFAVMSFIHFLGYSVLWVNICLLGLTFFFSNFGPNTTTYILPTQLYPTIVRATCHGFSAAMGKAGAVAGTVIVKRVQEHFGLKWLFFSCAAVALVGAAVTHLFVKSDAESKRILNEAEQRYTLKNRHNKLTVASPHDVEVALFLPQVSPQSEDCRP